MDSWPVSADDGDVTDNSGTRLQGWQGVLAAGLAVLTASTVTLVTGLTDPASADTVVTAVTRAVVALPDGSEHAAVLGETLPRGAVVRTGAEGGARLSAAGRDVFVGALSTLAVVDGVTEQLRRGQVMVDSRDGARLRLDVDGDTVRTPAGGLTRVERGPVLRVAAFRETATLTTRGRQATSQVPALYQVSTQYATLPGAASALTLRKDAWERRLVADLTAADDDLLGFATGLRGTEGTVVLAAARRDLVSGLTDPTARADQGERALSVAVAEAGRAGPPTGNLTVVRSARSAGGSWGVVAAIVRASVTDVSGRLDRSLAPGARGRLGHARRRRTRSARTGAARPAGRPRPLAGLRHTGRPVPRPGRSPSPRPTTDGGTPTPSPSSSPGLVEQVVTIINDVLPDPLPTLGVPLLP